MHFNLGEEITLIKQNVFTKNLCAAALVLWTMTASADNSNKECPVGLVNGLTLDQEFGPGTRDITHCLEVRKKAKVVISINRLHGFDKNGKPTLDKPYFIDNLHKMRETYEVTHGMKIGTDVDIIIVATNSGVLLLADPATALPAQVNDPNYNPAWKSLVEEGLKWGFKFYLCQQAARTYNIKTQNIIQGVEMVPGGNTAILDLQMRGYAYLQP